MSTSLLYHAFSIRGYQYVSTRYERGRVIFKVRHNKTDLRCSKCGSRRIICKGTVDRSFHAVPIGLKPVDIELDVQRVLCLDCGALRQVKIDSFVTNQNPELASL